MTTHTLIPTTTPTSPTDGGHPPRIAVIIGSVRKDRVGGDIAAWAAAHAEQTGAAVDLIDLASVDLPDDALLEPGGGPRSEIAARIDEADAYVVVTPEFNHSYPAALKRAIDWHFSEWMFKAATVVSYGAWGGHLAAEHLRTVLAELRVVTTRRSITLAAPWQHLDDSGTFTPPDSTHIALDEAIHELVWWAETLRTARRVRPLPN